MSDGPSFTKAVVIDFDQTLCLAGLSDEPHVQLLQLVELADYLMAPLVRKAFVQQLAAQLPTCDKPMWIYKLKLAPVSQMVFGNKCSLTLSEKKMLILAYLAYMATGTYIAGGIW